MTTLLAIYRRPEGDGALETFEQRYTDEHLPLVAHTPGLRRIHAQRVAGQVGGETDIVLMTAMEFDDRAALDEGLRSDAMRAAGRNLREIIDLKLTSLLILEDAPDVVPEIGS
jgi:uncharacterized protein (TIGR02118 family)